MALERNARPISFYLAAGLGVGAIVCMACCGGIYFVIAPMVDRVEHQARARDAAMFHAGENAYLYWNGKGSCYLPRTSTDNDELWTFIRAGNHEAIKGISRRMLSVDENTKVAIVHTYRTSCAVRILEGEHRGELGFAENETLRKAPVH